MCDGEARVLSGFWRLTHYVVATPLLPFSFHHCFILALSDVCIFHGP